MKNEELIATGLKRFRKTFKLNQKEIADVLGVTDKAYQNYEYGKNFPTAISILKLARKYNVTTDYLVGLSDEPHPPKLDKETLNLIEALQVWKDSKSTKERQYDDIQSHESAATPAATA